jgi:hypothetical protein
MNDVQPLRSITRELIGRIGKADLLVGIPCFNNAATVAHVVAAAARGLREHFPGSRGAIVIADGGSTLDDTRELALAEMKAQGVPGVVGIYRGLPGKGSAVRMIFAAAGEIEAKALALLDADLRSVTPQWIERLLGPVVKGGYEFVAPLYRRYKFDGTITNNVTYNMLRCLFGKRVRQPIGGEFAFSGRLAAELEALPIWHTDVARFGIDIWLTVNALIREVRICQTHLGVKVHDAKDPAASLEPMFRQVVGTLFALMEETDAYWIPAGRSAAIDVWGAAGDEEPEAFPIDFQRLVEHFYLSWQTLRGAWGSILRPETFEELEACVNTGRDVFLISTDLWARILFEFAAAYHHRPAAKKQVIEVLSPLYFARVASFIRRVGGNSNEEAEAVVEEQARIFEIRKPYLLELWNASPGEKMATAP